MLIFLDRMSWYISFIDKFKKGIFLLWIASEPFIHIYKPEFLEVRYKNNQFIVSKLLLFSDKYMNVLNDEPIG